MWTSSASSGSRHRRRRGRIVRERSSSVVEALPALRVEAVAAAELIEPPRGSHLTRHGP